MMTFRETQSWAMYYNSQRLIRAPFVVAMEMLIKISSDNFLIFVILLIFVQSFWVKSSFVMNLG